MLCIVEQCEGPVDYASGLALQQERIAQRKAGTIPDTLILLKHSHVYTLGRNARRQNVLVSEEFLRSRGAEVFETDRGGDVGTELDMTVVADRAIEHFGVVFGLEMKTQIQAASHAGHESSFFT
jgi:hypothetical protein